MNPAESLKHTKWECKYPVVWIPKYRKKSLYQGLRSYLGELLKDLAARKECKILEGHLVLDHVRILISIPPKYSVSQAVGFIHLFNLSTLGLDNDIGKLPDARVRDASTLAGQDGDGMMGNHGLHIRHILNGFLAANEPESGGKNDRTRYEYPYIHSPVGIPIQHESQHDDDHYRPHHDRHVYSSFAEKQMIRLVRVQIHQPQPVPIVSRRVLR